MSIGDIIRLNRMYKCGAPYISATPETVKGSTEAPPNKVIDSSRHSPSNRTIFGVLIFRAIEQSQT